jgi:hypothetical protein
VDWSTALEVVIDLSAALCSALNDGGCVSSVGGMDVLNDIPEVLDDIGR